MQENQSSGAPENQTLIFAVQKQSNARYTSAPFGEINPLDILTLAPAPKCSQREGSFNASIKYLNCQYYYTTFI